ncbi:universal stress protein [Streptomyces sp. NPDC001450]
MTRPVMVGLDGSPESRAAAEWAAREAMLRSLPLKIVHVSEPAPELAGQAPLLGAETHQYRTERVPREAAEGIRLCHPGLEVAAEQRTGMPADALCEAAEAAELLVLGSRGLGGFGGFMTGSVSLSVIARAERPVVLVRAGEQAADEHRMDPTGVPSAAAPFRPVVLGLDTRDPDETLLEFAFDAAARRKARLRIVHGWNPPPSDPYAMSAGYDLRGSIGRSEADVLAGVVRPWLQKFPDVHVTEASRPGHAAPVLAAASRDASLVVVGRRIRTSRLGAHIGHVTHAVLHHVDAPVAVVAHG